jgi:hypothetical protein
VSVAGEADEPETVEADAPAGAGHE